MATHLYTFPRLSNPHYSYVMMKCSYSITYFLLAILVGFASTSSFCEAFAFVPSDTSFQQQSQQQQQQQQKQQKQQKQKHQLWYPPSNHVRLVVSSSHDDMNHNINGRRRPRLPRRRKLGIPKPPRIITITTKATKRTTIPETENEDDNVSMKINAIQKEQQQQQQQQQRGIGRRIRSSIQERNQNRRGRIRLRRRRREQFDLDPNNNHDLSSYSGNFIGQKWRPIRIVRFVNRQRKPTLQNPSIPPKVTRRRRRNRDNANNNNNNNDDRIISSSEEQKSLKEMVLYMDQENNIQNNTFDWNSNSSITNNTSSKFMIDQTSQKTSSDMDCPNGPFHKNEKPKESSFKKNNNNGKNKKGKRLEFSTKYKTSRSIRLTSSSSSSSAEEEQQYDGLLKEYMTQPITSFSWQSFQETPTAGKRRRWMIRPLELSEMKINNNKSLNFEEERLFRLAVPLMPLLGIDLTPIIDLEVIPTIKDNNTNINRQQMLKQKFFPMDNKKMTSSSFITIRSLRLSILETEDEVQRNMKMNVLNNDKSGKHQRNNELPSPTKVSKDQSIQKMGNEAVNFAEKIDNWLNPHLSFEGIIQWEEGTANSKAGHSTITKRVVSIDSKATFSATIPPLPIAIPLPTMFLAEQIGSNLLKKALSLALNQFLRQLELDFKRWAEVDDKLDDDSNTPNIS